MMWIAEDGVFQGDPRFPALLMRKCEIHHHSRDLMWDLIVRAVERETPLYVWYPKWRSRHLGYGDVLNVLNSWSWWWQCSFPATDTVCRTGATADHATALADALQHLAFEHGGAK